jgi:hypothetical protein
MDSRTHDWGWAVASVDAAARRLHEIEHRLKGADARSRRIVHDTAWSSDAVSLYRRRAQEWQESVGALAQHVGELEGDLARTRHAIAQATLVCHG